MGPTAAGTSASEAGNDDCDNTSWVYVSQMFLRVMDREITYLATPLMIAFRIPAIPLMTAVIALPIARKTDLIYIASQREYQIVSVRRRTYAREDGTHFD